MEKRHTGEVLNQHIIEEVRGALPILFYVSVLVLANGW